MCQVPHQAFKQPAVQPLQQLREGELLDQRLHGAWRVQSQGLKQIRLTKKLALLPPPQAARRSPWRGREATNMPECPLVLAMTS